MFPGPLSGAGSSSSPGRPVPSWTLADVQTWLQRVGVATRTWTMLRIMERFEKAGITGSQLLFIKRADTKQCLQLPLNGLPLSEHILMEAAISALQETDNVDTGVQRVQDLLTSPPLAPPVPVSAVHGAPLSAPGAARTDAGRVKSQRPIVPLLGGVMCPYIKQEPRLSLARRVPMPGLEMGSARNMAVANTRIRTTSARRAKASTGKAPSNADSTESEAVSQRKKRRVWTTEEEKRMMKMHREGLSDAEIGKALDRTASAVQFRMKYSLKSGGRARSSSPPRRVAATASRSKRTRRKSEVTTKNHDAEETKPLADYEVLARMNDPPLSLLRLCQKPTVASWVPDEKVEREYRGKPSVVNAVASGSESVEKKYQVRRGVRCTVPGCDGRLFVAWDADVSADYRCPGALAACFRCGGEDFREGFVCVGHWNPQSAPQKRKPHSRLCRDCYEKMVGGANKPTAHSKGQSATNAESMDEETPLSRGRRRPAVAPLSGKTWQQADLDVVAKCFHEGLKDKEIAAKLGRSEAAVSQARVRKLRLTTRNKPKRRSLSDATTVGTLSEARPAEQAKQAKQVTQEEKAKEADEPEDSDEDVQESDADYAPDEAETESEKEESEEEEEGEEKEERDDENAVEKKVNEEPPSPEKAPAAAISNTDSPACPGLAISTTPAETQEQAQVSQRRSSSVAQKRTLSAAFEETAELVPLPPPKRQRPTWHVGQELFVLEGRSWRQGAVEELLSNSEEHSNAVAVGATVRLLWENRVLPIADLDADFHGGTLRVKAPRGFQPELKITKEWGMKALFLRPQAMTEQELGFWLRKAGASDQGDLATLKKRLERAVDEFKHLYETGAFVFSSSS